MHNKFKKIMKLKIILKRNKSWIIIKLIILYKKKEKIKIQKKKKNNYI